MKISQLTIIRRAASQVICDSDLIQHTLVHGVQLFESDISPCILLIDNQLQTIEQNHNEDCTTLPCFTH